MSPSDEKSTETEAVTVPMSIIPLPESIPKETAEVVVTPEQKKAVQEATGSIWKKVLWWGLGILGVIGVIVTLVLLFIPRKDKKNPVSAIIDKVKKETDKADVEAKVAVAKAEGIAETKIEEIKTVLEIDDVDARRKRLADLL